MRVAINASILDDHPTGLGIYTREMLRELAGVVAPSDEVVVFTGTSKPFEGLPFEMRVLDEALAPSRGRGAGIKRFLWTQTAFAAKTRGRFDVLLNTTHHGVMVPTRTPQVVTVQNDMDVAFKFPGQHRLQYLYYKFAIGSLLRRSAAILTTSEYAKETIERRYPTVAAPIYVAYNGYDPAIFHSMDSASDAAFRERMGVEGRPYLLVVNATYPHKNVGVVLEAISHLGDPSMMVCIAGYSEDYLQPLLDTLPSERRRRVIALRQCTQRELRALYHAAFALCMPSLHESFGMPVIEAMASGCPVICSTASALPEVAGEAAIYFSPADPSDLATAVERLRLEPSLRTTMIRSGLIHCRPFRWRRVAEVTYNALHYAIGRHGRD